MKRNFIYIGCIIFVFLTSGWCNNTVQKGNGLFDMGVFALGENDFKSALENFKIALKYDPDNPLYLHFLGKTYMELEEYLLAQKYFNEAFKKKPSLYKLDFDMAIVQFKMKQYKRAGQLFVDIIENDILDESFLEHYYAGLCLFMQNKYENALYYFTKAGMMNKAIKETCQFYSGICYYKMQNFVESKKLLTNLANNSSSITLKESAEKWLKKIQDDERKFKPYSLYSKLCFIYDDNVSVISPYLSVGNEDDFLFQGFFSGKYHFYDDYLHLIGAGYSQYLSVHYDKSEYDMTGSRLDLYYRYCWNPFRIGFNYQPAYYWLDNTRYMSSNTLKTYLTWKHISSLIFRFAYSYSMDHYFEENEKNGHTHELNLKSYYSIKNNISKIYGNIIYEENHPLTHEYQHKKVKLKMKYIFKIKPPFDLTVSLIGKYQKRRHDYLDSTYLIKRDDNAIGFELLTSRQVYDKIWASLEYRYTRNNSNIDYYDYRKNSIGLSFRMKY